MVSFDDRTTWEKWNGSSWGTHAGGLDNLQTGNTIAEIQTGLINYNISSETYLDFAFDLSTTDSSVTPDISSIYVSYITNLAPTSNILYPQDGADLKKVNSIVGKSTDVNGVDFTRISIQNFSTGKYYN